ncbi:Josephin-domain-containing protein [Lentinula raphanica]|uniref:ubiquitinyl hydrolase 1 n=1 Tax=Lentinula raphanica TaxID=153919 RepID=A0AA38P9W1_9AGAR|nr:Josephin-domain-containing protein [Lentinula raphanica]KAJ3977634.1 Josephin-domain-containing protein [Lentinula raphanica]
MAGLENLLPLIYHERQQPGSMLCAQHALNSLLQGNIFSASDLAAIAQDLDDLEGVYATENPSVASQNMDDSGFFSVQVLENALDVWGLSLLRWRGEQMRPYQDRPEEERAFIFNSQQHWYTLRRFGSSETFQNGVVSGHWFNLNSSLQGPEWVSKLYLSMFIRAAEADGYSVFVVRPSDPEAPLFLPKTEADDVAATLLDPSSASTDHPAPATEMLDYEGMEDVDMELQMALQASLGYAIPPSPADPPHMSRNVVPLPTVGSNPASGSGSGTRTPSQQEPLLSPISPLVHDPGSVEASVAQSRRIYERMLEEQNQAQRELIAEGGGNLRRRQEEEEEEEEMLRRAIAESEALANLEGHEKSGEDDDQNDMDFDHAHISQSSGAGHRVYDDEDAELQAALRASLEGYNPLPENISTPTTANVSHIASTSESSESNVDDDESIASEDTAPAPSEAPISMEEMRRRRLAHFVSS